MQITLCHAFFISSVSGFKEGTEHLACVQNFGYFSNELYKIIKLDKIEEKILVLRRIK